VEVLAVGILLLLRQAVQVGLEVEVMPQLTQEVLEIHQQQAHLKETMAALIPLITPVVAVVVHQLQGVMLLDRLRIQVVQAGQDRYLRFLERL